MDYKEKYLKGLEEAKKTLDSLDENYRCHELTKDDIRIIYSRLFPELAESENERIIKTLQEYVKNRNWPLNGPTQAEALAWLEKQKDISESEAYKILSKKGFVIIERELYDELCDKAEQKEQKPNFSEKDSTDFEIEVHEIIAQARNDSRLNDADVLKQFEEEAAFALMLKANKLIEQQKPAEWSEEDKDMLNCCISSIEEAKENRYAYKETDGDTSYDREIAFLKSLRPSWKPSEEQMKWLKDVIETVPMSCRQQQPLESLYADLQKLPSLKGFAIAVKESLNEPKAADISANFEKAEKEKKDFVTSEFIRCIKKVEGFNEGEAYWLEYIGDDTYVGRSDNILNSTFNITPKELFTHFRRLNDFGVKCGVWKIIPLFKVGDFIKKKGKDYVPWKITEVNEEGGYYCGNYQHGYPTELMFRDQRDYERVDNPGMGVPKINGKPVSTENNVVNISHWVPSDDQLEAIRFLMEDYKPWLLSASEARKELGAIYDEMLKLAKK